MYIDRNIRTSLRTYKNKTKCVSLYKYTHTYIRMYVCFYVRMYHIIHPYALLSSRPDLLLLFLALVFLPLFFLNNNNVKSYLLSRRSLEPAVGGRSSVRGEADRISWKELERYANICRANVNDELSMPWTSTYVHTYVCMNVCMDTQCVHFIHMHIYIHTKVFSCVALVVLLHSARSARLLVDCNYRKHSTIKEEWQKNKTEMKLFTRLLWNSLHTVECEYAWMYIHTCIQIHICMCKFKCVC